MQEEHNGQDIQTVWFDRGSGGLELLRIYNRLGEATIYLHGAHIASYKKRGEAELLFMSPHRYLRREAERESRSAFRGSVSTLMTAPFPSMALYGP